MNTEIQANGDYVTVIGIFASATNARQAIDQLRNQRLDIRDVSVVERDPRRHDPSADYASADWDYRAYSADEFGDETLGGMVIGGLTGGALGALAGLGALVIPGIGPLVAVGPLLGALTGGAVGAAAGALVGALIETFEVPEDHAAIYSERISAGNTFVAVRVNPSQAALVRDILRDAGAERFDWGTTYRYSFDTPAALPDSAASGERGRYVWVS